MTLLRHTIGFLLWMGCTRYKTSAGAVCEDPPLIDFGEIVSGRLSGYKENDRVKYTCNHGYTLSGSQWITCSEKIWVPGPPQCLKRSCGSIPKVSNAQIEGRNKEMYEPGETVHYQCDSGFVIAGSPEIICREGNWSAPPSCEKEKPCDFPAIENGKLSQSLENYRNYYFPMMFGQYVDYHCTDGYQTPSGSTWFRIVCSAGGWSPEPKCLKKCHLPWLQNGFFQDSHKRVFTEGERVKYGCSADYDTEHEGGEITCTRDDWSPPPRCIRKNMTCEPPPEIAGGSIEGVKKSRYLPGESAHYQCWQGFEMMGPSTVMCHSSTWTELPQCKGRGGKCGPPPLIEHGELLSFRKNEYAQGTTLEYKCPSLYVLEGSTTITCANGQWTNPPVCLVACTASEEDMARNNIHLRWRVGTKLYSKSGDFIEFQCKKGYQKDPSSSPFRVQCVEGTIEYPHCKPAKNCTLDEQIMKENNIESQSQRQRVYLTGDIVFFECKHWWHTKVSAADRFRAECLDGVLQYPSCGSRFG
ncbi:complement factor H-related protein 1-like [Colius striatus]|uniref:complement factor H-related protein 1-like n=1 Tax=Colius striatus TaxID=57412 RepID=UPI002B1DD4F8|nr:complement factor H-related protein 1-like [Colius striatus]